jgi:hypothetical protein
MGFGVELRGKEFDPSGVERFFVGGSLSVGFTHG